MIVENKSGRQAIVAPVVVDATGDADVIARAGLPYQKGNADGLMQPPSLCFRLGGIDADQASESFRSGLVSQAVNKPMDYNGQEYPNFLWTTRSKFRPDEMMLAGVRVTEVDATDGWSLTRAEMEGRQQMEWVIAQLRNVPGFEKCYIVDIAAQIGVRETRRIYGEHILQEREVLEGIRFPDAIAQGTYPIDIHNPLRRGIVFKELDGTTREVLEDGSTVHGYWTPDGKKRDTVCYQVPYRSLVPKGLDNALAAGRCISATHEAAGAVRVMMNCMQFGQAAGVAAALSAQDGTRPRDIDPALLRARLEEQGCRFLT